MPSPATYAKILRRPVVRVDQERAVVPADGLYWAVIGEFTTPAPGRTPAFIAHDIRQLMVDGSETVDMIDNLAPAYVQHLEALASDELARSRRYAA
ncbi:hypothetical protein [Cupriavidus sp. a3]|uniref:hypothetical protein n=1 Tax=Cupriavidus sp. a3 TaxID=3242158 RepID=UPI003D9C16FB